MIEILKDGLEDFKEEVKDKKLKQIDDYNEKLRELYLMLYTECFFLCNKNPSLLSSRVDLHGLTADQAQAVYTNIDMSVKQDLMKGFVKQNTDDGNREHMVKIICGKKNSKTNPHA